MYRKVIYQTWIHAIAINKEIPLFNKKTEKPKPIPGGISIESVYDNIQEGTHQWSELMSGYFHTWGTESRELAEDVLIDTIAIIEDVTTGQIHKVDPSKMRFVQPLTRQHSSEQKENLINSTPMVVDANSKYIIAGTVNEQKVIDLLTSIDSKLNSI